MAAAVIGFPGLASSLSPSSSMKRLSLSKSAVVGGQSSSELRGRSLKIVGTPPENSSTTGSKIQCVSVSKDTPTITSSGLPLREIPGSYGLPFFGAFKDKLDFYWFEKVPKYYENRRDKHNSTVYRMNTVPGPPGFPDPRVIILLDEKSFPTLFDIDKVEKKDVFTGTYMTDVKYTGGYRVLPYLDPSEEKHTLLKEFCFEVLKSSGRRVFPELHSALANVFDQWEATVKKDGKVSAVDALPLALLRFNIKAFVNVDPTANVEASLGSNLVTTVRLWLGPQIIPVTVLPVPKLLAPLAELLLHTFPIPFLLVKKPYEKVTAFFRAHSGELLDLAETKFGLNREEALHNLVFYTCFNSFGGFNIFLPSMIKRLGSTSPEFQRELSAEVRKAVKVNGGLNPAALSCMPLVESAVLEVLRIEPPVPYQYGRAKKDFIIESHDAAFQVKKGEMLAGYMPIACQDPKTFTDPKTYDPKRFLGEEGQKLVKYVLWSNGRQTEDTTVQNKQCAGKDFVTNLAKLMVAEIYFRFETIQVDAVTGVLTSLTRPSS